MINVVDVDSMYTEYKKSKGVKVKEFKSGQKMIIRRKPRTITAPNSSLKFEQRQILQNELSRVKLHESAYGFVAERSIYDNAKRHLGANAILNIDLKDFFTTVTREQVLEALLAHGFNNDRAEYISRVCTRYGVLPQGAPTSPTLSNIVAKAMDKKISTLCFKMGTTYTRYADDITVSGENAEKLIEIRQQIFRIVDDYGWKISTSKVKIISKGNRTKPLQVTGIVLNTDEPSISSKTRRKFESKIHHIECEIKDGVLKTRQQLAESGRPLDSLVGYANFLSQANPKYSYFMERLSVIKGALK